MATNATIEGTAKAGPNKGENIVLYQKAYEKLITKILKSPKDLAKELAGVKSRYDYIYDYLDIQKPPLKARRNS